MNKKSFSEFVLALMASASDGEPAAHQARMVELLGSLIQFDMAWWGWCSFTEGRIIFAQSALHRLPANYETSVRLVAPLDPFIRYGRRLPVFSLTVDSQSDSLPESYRAFARKYDIGAILNGHCQLEQASPYNFFMSVYRRCGQPAFTREEVEDFRLILQHLEQSLSLSLQAKLRSLAGSNGDAAIIDENRQLVRSTCGFESRLALEGVRIVREDRVIERLVARGGTWQGQQLSLHAEEYGKGLKLLLLSARGGWDLLSPQERRVAAALLRGASAREVAGELGTSPNTVRNQVAAIYAKLGVSDRLGLSRKLHQGG
ncbi:helix-turn-helix transcriptional regulator [Paracoccus ravus]|uniref:helix-turn-helix transcriptional regulator n=1 Tax=Paracoccus ravus TaxID=2447760 RepID=UPI00106E023C|nr:helix-turn-helix transcriptional regulator [Paracoccus ravus]